MDQYFFLSEGNVLVKGAKHSLILNLSTHSMNRVNDSARKIIELGERGLKISEVLEELKPEIKAEDVLAFIEEVSIQCLVHLSSQPKLPSTEDKFPPVLDFLWIEVSSRCNLKCIHCYADSESQKTISQSAEEIKRYMDEAAALGCKKIQLTGGECLLREDIKELLKHAKSKEFDTIEVFTNGTLLTEEIVSFFAKEKITAALSLHSYRAETHDAVTRVPGSFQKTLNGLKLLLAYGVPTRCCTTALKQNEEDLEATGYFLYQLGVFRSAPDPVRPSGRGKSMENWPSKYGLRTMQTQPNFTISSETYQKNSQ